MTDHSWEEYDSIPPMDSNPYAGGGEPPASAQKPFACRILKYDIPEDPVFSLELPVGSRILDIQVQGEEPKMWVSVPSDETRTTTRKFRTYATGQEIKDARKLSHRGTFQLAYGMLVFHVLEECPV